jgi:hypothetical protein
MDPPRQLADRGGVAAVEAAFPRHVAGEFHLAVVAEADLEVLHEPVGAVVVHRHERGELLGGEEDIDRPAALVDDHRALGRPLRDRRAVLGGLRGRRRLRSAAGRSAGAGVRCRARARVAGHRVARDAAVHALAGGSGRCGRVRLARVDPELGRRAPVVLLRVAHAQVARLAERERTEVRERRHRDTAGREAEDYRESDQTAALLLRRRDRTGGGDHRRCIHRRRDRIGGGGRRVLRDRVASRGAESRAATRAEGAVTADSRPARRTEHFAPPYFARPAADAPSIWARYTAGYPEGARA